MHANDSNVEECRGMTGDELTKHLSFLRLREGGIVQHAGPCPLMVNRHIERQVGQYSVISTLRMILHLNTVQCGGGEKWDHDRIYIYFSSSSFLFFQVKISLSLSLSFSLFPFPFSFFFFLTRTHFQMIKFHYFFLINHHRWWIIEIRQILLVISNLTNHPTLVLTPYSIYEKRFSVITKERKKKEKKICDIAFQHAKWKNTDSL